MIATNPPLLFFSIFYPSFYYNYVLLENARSGENKSWVDFKDSGIVSTSDVYKITCLAGSIGDTYIKNKLVKYETDENYVYIYTKFVNCVGFGGITTCNNIVNYVADTSDVLVLDCSTDNDGNLLSTCPSVIKQEPASDMLPKMADYVLNNLSDKLNTYKSTFKKSGDNFYWYSTELVK